MAKATAKVTKSTTVKAKNKINKAPKAAAAPARNEGPYNTTINPDSCNCKSQQFRPPAGGCKHIKALRASQGAAAASAPVAAPVSTVMINPESGLQGQGHVLEEGGEVYDNDLAY